MRQAKWSALRLVGTYAVAAAIWILASDLLLSLLPARVQDGLQTVKGLLFVVITALVLYVLVRNLYRDIDTVSADTDTAETILEQVMETVPVGVLLVNPEGNVTYLNQTAREMLYMSDTDAIGQPLERICNMGSSEGIAVIGQLLSFGAVDELVLRQPDAEESRTVIARAAALDPRATISGWVVAFADVTESSVEARRVRKFARGYRFLAEAQMACARAGERGPLLAQVAELAVESGSFVGAWAALRTDDERFEQVASDGLSERAREIGALVCADLADAHSAISKHLLASDLAVSNDIERDLAHPWSPVAKQDLLGSSVAMAVVVGGRIVAVLMLFARRAGRFGAHELEMLGQLRGALMFAFERLGLEERRIEAEQETSERATAYRRLFLAQPFPMFIVDVENLGFLEVNDAAVKKFGYSRQKFDSMTFDQLYRGSDSKIVRRALSRESTGFSDADIWTLQDSSGRTFSSHIRLHTIDWDGRRQALVMAYEVARMQ